MISGVNNHTDVTASCCYEANTESENPHGPRILFLNGFKLNSDLPGRRFHVR